MKLKPSVMLCCAALLFGACSERTDAPAVDVSRNAQLQLSNQVVLDWQEHTIAALVEKDGYADPLFATRVLTLVHLAMHDAINASAHREYTAYRFDEREPGAHPVAAAAAAAHRVLRSVFEPQAEALSQKLAESLASLPEGSARRLGVSLGERAGQVLLASRSTDRSSEVLAYEAGRGPGKYQLTTPGVIAHPGWENVTPWALDASSQFRPAPPPALDSALYAAAYDEVRSKGAVDSTTRTDDESASARFWYEFSERGWNRVARVVAQQEGLGLYATARLFALVNIALADSYIAGWDAKFHYDFWRPVTAIAAADTDGNPDTEMAPDWTTFLPTPPVQDYPSTHSVLGAAAAEVLARFFGARGDQIGFSMTSTTAAEPNVEQRAYESFERAAAANAESRVLAGIHFRFSTDAGLAQGKQIGAHAFDTQLQSAR